MKKYDTVFIVEGDYKRDIEKKMQTQIKSFDILNQHIQTCFDYMDKYRMFVSSEKRQTGIRFVGSFCVKVDTMNQIQFYSFPKYYKWNSLLEDSVKDFPIIIQAIEKTNHCHDFFEDATYNPDLYNKDQKNLSTYSIAKWIVEDYSANGIYWYKEKKYSRQGKGHVSWAKTVSKLLPYIDGDNVIYHKPISAFTNRNDKVILSQVHACVVKEAMDYLKGIGEKLTVVDPDYERSYLGRLNQFIKVIKSFQKIVFADRDIKLLRAMDAWCLKQSRYYKMPTGTVSFQNVWEDCLWTVFGNLSKNFNFGSPEYRIGIDQDGHEKKQQVDNNSIPDVINIFEDNDKIKFLLLDAKYYTGVIGESGKRWNKLKPGYDWIDGFPGYKDIAKQYDYYDTLSKEYGLDEGINAFMLPYCDIPGIQCYPKTEVGLEWFRYLGYAYKGDIDIENNEICQIMHKYKKDNKFISGNKITKKKILTVQVDPNWLYRETIKNSIKKEELVKITWNYLSSLV